LELYTGILQENLSEYSVLEPRFYFSSYRIRGRNAALQRLSARIFNRQMYITVHEIVLLSLFTDFIVL